METFLRDLRCAARTLVRTPGFTAVAILSLGLGIGLNTTIFSLANGLLFRPMPFDEPERLVAIAARNARLNRNAAQISFADFNDWRTQSRSFERSSAYRETGFNLSGGAEPERVQAAVVSAETFRTLRIRPALGRDFLPADDDAGAARVAILGHDLWQRRFAGDRGIPGQAVTLDGESYTVIGVMPPGLAFPEFADLWVPLAGMVDRTDRAARELGVIARLRDGVTVEAARTEMAGIAARLERAYPESNAGWGVNLRRLNPGGDEGFGPLVLALLGAVAFVLLIACANVGNLLLVRLAARQREMSLRLVLGAARRRLLRQLLTESLLLGLAGAGVGLLLAVWGVDLARIALPADLAIPYWISFDIDGRVLAFTGLVSLATVIAFGLAPALDASRPDIAECLKEAGARTTASARTRRLRSALVIGEVALALVLLSGAGLMIQSFLGLRNLDLGMERPGAVAVMRVTLPAARYAEPRQVAGFFDQILERVRRMPGVTAASAFDEGRGRLGPGELTIAGRTLATPEEASAVRYQAGYPDVFRTLGVPVRRGRAFAAADGPAAPRVAVINEAMAQRFWPGQDPLGRQLRLGGAGSEQPWLTVVGVVGNVREPVIAAGGLRAEAWPLVYRSSLQEPGRNAILAVRAGADPMALVESVRREVLAVDPDQPVSMIMTLERHSSFSTVMFRWFAAMFAIFGALALALAAVGIYGLVAYAAGQRTHEIGIRVSLGASTRDVMGLVLAQGLKLVLAGVGLGFLGALALTRVLAVILYDVSPTDPGTLVGVAAVLGGVALLASWIPARRATRVDPMVALRYE